MNFREVQRFRQTWMWILVFFISLPLITIFGRGMVRQMVFGQPWGDNPLPDPALAIEMQIKR